MQISLVEEFHADIRLDSRKITDVLDELSVKPWVFTVNRARISVAPISTGIFAWISIAPISARVSTWISVLRTSAKSNLDVRGCTDNLIMLCVILKISKRIPKWILTISAGPVQPGNHNMCLRRSVFFFWV